ncbi:eukaryotic translation initiation factor 3 subunit C [Clathrospora elynae]|uniref:Eukaryotic translation initiation factor 3 subunit C n=1 Tax=Clathrospora elynae TaxID=706981 RepID=A0A6A5T603_9PLEO|nr:eukaryotic translation initiation factor 3 subunit C [Clathrospora elynae]
MASTSRFFAASDSSSDESSEEELYSNGEGSEQDDSDKDSDDDSDDDDSSSDSGSETGANRFLKDAESESESEDEDTNKVLKSAKDKRFDELEATIRLIENAQKINDWAVISDQFDKLIRQVPTLTKQNDGKVPKLYVQAIADLETVVGETHEKQKVTPKKMNAVNGRGFNAVRQKIKKHNRDYQKDIDAYRANKDDFMREEEAVVQAPKEKKKKNKTPQLIAEIADEVTDEGFTRVGRDGKGVLYTQEGILKHIRSIVEQRGRKNADKLDHIRTLEKLVDVAVNDYQRIRVLLTLISTRFDLTSGTANHMSQDQWKLADQEIGKLLAILENSNEIVVVENAEEWEDDDKLPTITPDELFRVPGSIVSFVERLDDELIRSLQHIDPHTSEYIERLTDEASLYAQLVRTLIYVESLKKKPGLDFPQDPLNRIVMRRLEHVYFKPSQVITILENNVWTAIPESLDSEITPRAISNDTASLVQTLCTYLFQHSEGIIRARAMLCQIYFLSLHDQYYKARDMMLMSHLQETISNFDVNTQILFNRALVQVGLCAFRAGMVYEAQTSLQEICGSNRQKELLAQGLQMQRFTQISPEQERLERQRQLPFHMHINLELLECVYLTCSMLLEIPLLAQLGSSPDLRKRVISKTYRRLLEYHERQIFTGPPENTRDHVMQASKALSSGEWKKSAEFINSIKIWELMANSEKIQEMLSAQIQEEGLRTYLFTYAPFYDTLAVSTLAGMFELSERKVSAVVSKMISHEELGAALDQVNSAIIFRKGVELSRLQTLALSLSDKASGLIESNEKTLEQRTQGTANAFERQGGRGGRGGRGGGRGGGGRGGGGRGGGGPRGGRNQQFTGGALGSAIQA